MNTSTSQTQQVINNNNTTNNILVNVNMFGGAENISYIDNKFKFNCLRNMNMVSLLERVHFDVEHPENHNVRVKNVKMNMMQYIDNDEWKTGHKDYVLGHMVKNGWRILNAFYEEHKEKIECKLDEDSPSRARSELRDDIYEINHWLDRLDRDETKVFKETKAAVFMMVIDKKAVLLQRRVMS